MPGCVFPPLLKMTLSVLFAIDGLLAGLAVNVRPTKDAMVAMTGNDTAKKQAAIDAVKAHPQCYAPPAFFALSAVLFQDGKKDEAAFWFYAGQLRLDSTPTVVPMFPHVGHRLSLPKTMARRLTSMHSRTRNA